jgi:plasmid stabilization system protein ParE
MTYRLIIQSRAEQDILEAFNYIGDRSPESALRWYSRLKAAIESLQEMPTRCSIASESVKLGIELRQLVTGKHTGVYRIIFLIHETEQTVDIITIRHGSRKELSIEDIDENDKSG